MSINQLEKKVLKLQSMHKKMIEEIQYIDQLLRDIGFEEGLASLKSTALKLKEESKD